MGCADLHRSQKGWTCLLGEWFPGIQQSNQALRLCAPSYSGNSNQATTLQFFFKIFEHVHKNPVFPPQGPQNGPRDPGDRFKIKKIEFFQKIEPEVSTIFEI